jgi:hypothetical protein
MNGSAWDRLSDRRILGFDIRQGIAVQSRRPLRNQIEPTVLCQLTLDPEIWPSLLTDDSEIQRNGFNLYFDSDLPTNHQDDGVKVAFDVSAECAENLVSTFGYGTSPPRSSSSLAEEGWLLLGFDVADPRTQQSGLCSFDLSAVQLEQVRRLLPGLGVLGITGRTDQAAKLESVLNQVIPDHAPFYTCGVWIKP